MRDPERIKRILSKLEQIWSESPDVRFFQLLINLKAMQVTFNGVTGEVGIKDPFAQEDDKLENALDDRIKRGRLSLN